MEKIHSFLTKSSVLFLDVVLVSGVEVPSSFPKQGRYCLECHMVLIMSSNYLCAFLETTDDLKKYVFSFV